MERRSEAGYSLVALIATITIMMIMMGAAAPSWKYLMKDMREEELFFRGDQIATGIERFQKKNGGALPTSLDALVKGKFLRKAYAEPMAKHGKWRFIRQGELVPGGPVPGIPGLPGAPSPSPSPSAGPGSTWERAAKPASPPPQTAGPFMGVASTSTDKSLRLMNGRDRYDQWLFIAGQQRFLGRQDVATKPGQPGPPSRAQPGTPPVKQ